MSKVISQEPKQHCMKFIACVRFSLAEYVTDFSRRNITLPPPCLLIHIFSLSEMQMSCMVFSRVHATLQPALSVGRLVGRLVGWLVTLYFFYDFISLTSLLWPK